MADAAHKSKFSTNQEAADRLFDLGYRAIPLRGKVPMGVGWQDAENPREFFRVHARPESNVGVVCGQDAGFSFETGPLYVTGLDFDFGDAEAASAAYSAMGEPFIRIGRNPRFMAVARMNAYSGDLTWAKEGCGEIRLQIIGRGRPGETGPRQFAQWGLHPDTGRPYQDYPDRDGRTLYDIPAMELPVLDLSALMGDLNVALARVGWAWKPKDAHGAQGEFDGPVTQEMIDDAKEHFSKTVAELARMAPGTGRGTETVKLGAAIGWLIKKGVIDLDACIAELRAAMPDNENAWTREFQRGAQASDGHRQRGIYERSQRWTRAQEGFERMRAEAGANADGFRAEQRAANRELYAAALITGVCDMLDGAVREREAGDVTRGQAVCYGFICSMLAAGMATHEALAKEWNDRAIRLNARWGTKYAYLAKQVSEALPGLQPTTDGWALCAADLMDKGRDAEAAIREAQALHKTPDAGEAMGPAEAAALAGVEGVDWAQDTNGDADSRSSSVFAYFMAKQLNVWPFFDEFTQKAVFRRLLKRPAEAEIVSDADLASWSKGIEASVAGLCSMATDRRQAQWAAVNYTPSARDVEMWLRDITGKHVFNSVCDKMAAWEAWDGQGRLDDWLARYTGHRPQDADYGYVCALGAYWLAGFAMRAQFPGSKFDTMLVLAGLGGSAKTDMLRVIAESVAERALLESAHLNYDNSTGINRIATATAGKLVVEIAEARNYRGHDAESMKAISTPLADEGRSNYGKDSFTKLRQFVICLTVNGIIRDESAGMLAAKLARLKSREARDELVRQAVADADFSFLRDPTGNRRFSIVKTLVYEVDREALVKELPQLVAEAKERAGELGMVDRGAYREMVMPVALRAIAGEREEAFMVAGDMRERLADMLAPFRDEAHLIATYKDFHEMLQLKTKAERMELQEAFRALGFIRPKTAGTGGAIWFVKGEKAKAKHIEVVRKDGRATHIAPHLGKGFADFRPQSETGGNFRPN